MVIGSSTFFSSDNSFPEEGTEEYEELVDEFYEQFSYDGAADARTYYGSSTKPEVDKKGMFFVKLEDEGEENTAYMPIAYYRNGSWNFIDERLSQK